MRVSGQQVAGLPYSAQVVALLLGQEVAYIDDERRRRDDLRFVRWVSAHKAT